LANFGGVVDFLWNPACTQPFAEVDASICVPQLAGQAAGYDRASDRGVKIGVGSNFACGQGEISVIAVLVLASSPLDQGQLHLGKELKLIKQTLDSSRNRDQYTWEARGFSTMNERKT
jgi:hypothetical protein